jgi:hypothetical protein
MDHKSMDQLSIDLENAPDVADLLSGKNPGDKVQILVEVTIAEKDDKRFVSDIDEVLEVDGETLAEETTDESTTTDAADESTDSEPTVFGKKKKPSFGSETEA